MFTQPAPSPAGNLAGSPVNSAGPAASSTPPSRTSRLRGLSYLRSYTQTRHNSHSNSQSQPAPPPLLSPSSSSSPSVATNNPWFSAVRNDSTTATTAAAPAVAPAAALAPADPSSRTNRLSQLVPALVHPLGLSNSSSGGRGQSGPSFALPIQRRSSESSAVPSSTGPNAAVPGAAAVDPQTDDMARLRAATAGDASGRNEASGAGSPPESLPSIRFSTFHDPRATRPSLKFAPIARTLPTGKEVIRVGRYSERDNQPNVPANAPSAAPVGFKSKVVSRRHCEFWYEDGKWYIKDVKSSSGTFLNHIRLSPPGTESKPYPVNDGDIVQMGIDFKGGEEMIFRCVKMRLELNRGWQNKLNTFNMATHKRLRNMTAGSGNKSSGSYSQDCSICLNSIAPCQCLFVAPCSHTWHYKCIRSLLVTNNNNPVFICPNCRASADLEADVEDPVGEEWEQLDSDEGAAAQPEGASLVPPGTSPGATDPSHPVSASVPVRRSRESVRANRFPSAQSQPQQSTDGAFPDVAMFLDPSSPPPPLQHQETAMDIDGGATLPNTAPATTTPSTTTTTNITPSASTSSASNTPSAISSHAMSDPVPIPIPAGGAGKLPQQQLLQQQHQRMQGIRGGGGDARTPSPPGAPVTNGPEGPITPRNDAGPWVFDGSDLRLRGEGQDGEGDVDGDDEMGNNGGGGGGNGEGGGGGDRTSASTPSSLEAAVQAAGARLLRGEDDVL